MTAVEVRDLKKVIKDHIDHADERMLRLVRAIFEADQQEDWWDELTDEQRKDIDEGIRQGENGETIAHEEMMKKHSKWLTK